MAPNANAVHLPGTKLLVAGGEQGFGQALKSKLRRAEYEHVAIVIPPGKPQIEYFDKGDQWTPRGDVLRCIINDGGPDNEPIIHIDDRDLSWTEFGRLLTTYAGWGMRVIFVPDDETQIEPRVDVREPSEDER